MEVDVLRLKIEPCPDAKSRVVDHEFPDAVNRGDRLVDGRIQLVERPALSKRHAAKGVSHVVEHFPPEAALMVVTLAIGALCQGSPLDRRAERRFRSKAIELGEGSRTV